MTHQLGYFNILPLYMLLLAATPFVLALASRSRVLLLAVSVSIWAVAGWNNINLPNFPTEGSWFLNPFSWQLDLLYWTVRWHLVKKGRFSSVTARC